MWGRRFENLRRAAGYRTRPVPHLDNWSARTTRTPGARAWLAQSFRAEQVTHSRSDRPSTSVRAEHGRRHIGLDLLELTPRIPRPTPRPLRTRQELANQALLSAPGSASPL